MQKVVVADANFTIDLISKVATVVQYPSQDTDQLQAWTMAQIGDADVLLLRGSVDLSVDAKLLGMGKKLKAVVTISVGYDNIDVVECKKRGIKIGYAGDILTEATSEFCVALLLTVSRRVIESQELFAAQRSPYFFELCGKALEGSVVGFYGLGRIGGSVAEKISAFHPKKIIYYNRKQKDNCAYEYVSFEELLKQSDFLLITVSAGPDTFGVFDKKAFVQMKNDSILVNISRGKVVNTAALCDALQSGQIGAAGLDVTDPEPLPLGHPLFGLKNCVITPHIGSANYTARRRMLELGEENVVSAVLGKEMPSPLNV